MTVPSKTESGNDYNDTIFLKFGPEIPIPFGQRTWTDRL